MKSTILLSIPVLLSFTAMATAQEPAPAAKEETTEQLNPLEKNFLMHFDKLAPEAIKAMGEPAEILPKMRKEVIKGMLEDKALSLTDEEKQLIKTNGEVKDFPKALKYWETIHQRFSAPELKDKRQTAMMLLISSHLKSFDADSSTLDKLLLVKAAQKMEDQMNGRKRIRNMMSLRQISLIMMEAEANNQAAVIPEKMKFRDDKGNKMDWVVLKEADSKIVSVHSPTPTGGKYLILKRDGAILSLSPEEAKEKYGVGK